MKTGVLAAAGGLAIGLAMPAMAGQLVIELNHEFSNAASPSGSGPWARATFTDKGAGIVGLTLECLLQDSNEFMAKANGGAGNPSGWAFNLDPTLNPANLQFSHLSGDSASSIFKQANTYKAGPDKFYDFLFQFGTGLTGGDVVNYDLSITSGTLLASSFDFVTTGGPAGKTGWHSSVHVQGIRTPSAGSGSSGWIGGGVVQGPVVPLPGPGVLALAGMGVIAARRRRAMA